MWEYTQKNKVNVSLVYIGIVSPLNTTLKKTYYYIWNVTMNFTFYVIGQKI